MSGMQDGAANEEIAPRDSPVGSFVVAKEHKAKEWHPGFPSHLRAFSDALLDLDSLQQSHLDKLFSQSSADAVAEKPTVYMKASLMMLSGIWEAFVEDLALNTALHLLQVLDDPDKLPASMRKLIASKLSAEKNELSSWFLAGDKWRDYSASVVRARIERLNTPKSTHIETLFTELFGVQILEEWEWRGRAGDVDVLFERKNTVSFIDGLVSHRGAVAHGRMPIPSPTDFPLDSFFLLNVGVRMNKVASLLHNRMNDELAKITQMCPWPIVRFEIDWTAYTREAS